MAEIIKLFNDLSFEKVDGYNIPFSRIISDYHEHARGIGPDVFVVKHYTNDNNGNELIRGYSPTDRIGYMKTIVENQDTIAAILDERREEAMEAIKIAIKNDSSAIYKWSDESHGIACIFIQCKRGIIGSAWLDSKKTIRKAQKMAAFVLYAIGYINSTFDKVLFDISFNTLPYEVSSFGRGEKADEIILKAIENENRDRLTAKG